MKRSNVSWSGCMRRPGRWMERCRANTAVGHAKRAFLSQSVGGLQIELCGALKLPLILPEFSIQERSFEFMAVFELPYGNETIRFTIPQQGLRGVLVAAHPTPDADTRRSAYKKRWSTHRLTAAVRSGARKAACPYHHQRSYPACSKPYHHAVVAGGGAQKQP